MQVGDNRHVDGVSQTTDEPRRITEKKLRVLQVGGGPDMGGVQKQLLAFLQRYDRSRFVVDVACTGKMKGPLLDDYLATGARLIPCKWSGYVIGFVWRLFRLLRREHYEVVHARMSEVSGAAILAATLAGVPLRISSYHHTKTHWRRPGLINRFAVNLLQWMNRRLATRIIGVSESCLDAYYRDWRRYPEKFQICYNGLEIEDFSQRFVADQVRREWGLPADSFVVGHIGGFLKSKNHEAVVDIAEHVLGKLHNVFFLLVGDGQLRQKIESKVAGRDLSQRFVFTGNRNDVPRMLSAMDVFLMPSINEGFPSVVVEAQLSGLPVVGSDIPGIKEVLCPGMRNFCRAPYDSKEMADQLYLLLKDVEFRSKLGREGQEYASKRFSMDKTVKQLECVYSSMTTRIL
jgi:glycosyltransferase involved in cell wall biosynthesis